MATSAVAHTITSQVAMTMSQSATLRWRTIRSGPIRASGAWLVRPSRWQS